MHRARVAVHRRGGVEQVDAGEPFLAEFPPEHRLSIPMRPSNRSLNLANAAAIVLYEALRQIGRT